MGYLNKFVVSRSSAQIYRQMLPLLQAEEGAEAALLNYVEVFLQGFGWDVEKPPQGLYWSNAALGTGPRMHWQVSREDLVEGTALGALAVMLGVLPSVADEWANTGGMALRLGEGPMETQALYCLQSSTTTVGLTIMKPPPQGIGQYGLLGVTQASQVAESEQALRQWLADVQRDIHLL